MIGHELETTEFLREDIMRSRKLHVKKDGTIGVCIAEDGHCPIGGKHFNTMNEARAWVEDNNEHNAIPTELNKHFENATENRSVDLDRTPHYNGKVADFAIDAADDEDGAHGSVFTRRDDVEQMVRGSLDRSMWDNEEDYENLVENVTDHISEYVDYGTGTWEGTDVPATSGSIDADDYWDIVKRLDE